MKSEGEPNLKEKQRKCVGEREGERERNNVKYI